MALLRQREELRDRQRPLPRGVLQADLIVQRQERWREVRGVYGVTGTAAEQRVELIFAVVGRAIRTTLQPAW